MHATGRYLLAAILLTSCACTGQITNPQLQGDDDDDTGPPPPNLADGGTIPGQPDASTVPGQPDASEQPQACEQCDGTAWQPYKLEVTGPSASELDNSPNPFLDYRMNVTFTGPSGQQYLVPGFFAGDGNGGATGNVWRVWFTPDEGGSWSYQIAFESGSQIAVAAPSTSGSTVTPPLGPHGDTGTLVMANPQATAEGFLGRGRLRAVGEHYLQFQDGSYWLKGGADSPENLLAYAGFDNTTQSRLYLHTYSSHIDDWRSGDPDWGGGKGKGIIGAINYLADNHVNSIYALLMNIGGDGQDVWPYAGTINPAGSGSNDNSHFDISKLDQWELVFAHAQRRGVALHLVLNEAEASNKRELDNGELGVERKLYYREMLARFDHHNAIQWNISEEYDLDFNFGVDRVKSFANYLKEVSPYDHPVTVHNATSLDAGWPGFGGFEPIGVTSFQIHNTSVEDVVEYWRTWSASMGNPWVISLDEFTVQTAGQSAPWEPLNVPNEYRKLKTWPIYLSGGQLEFILEGYLAVDDFRVFSQLWRETWHARKFLEELPFAQMEPADHLLSGSGTFSNGYAQGSISGQVMTLPGEIYAVYTPNSSATGYLDLTAATGEFTQRWYNPRTGQFVGDQHTVTGGGTVGLGSPPGDIGEDWATLLVRQ